MSDAEIERGGNGSDSEVDVYFLYTGQNPSEIPRDVTRVTVDQSVKIIGEEAFKYCNQLAEVVLNEGLEEIERKAFYCSLLNDIKIPSSVKVIGKEAFKYCNQLVELVLNEGLEEIKQEAFRSCYLLNDIKIPSSVKVIGKEAFSHCNQLVDVVLNKGLEEIKQEAFYGCISLSRLNIPSSVKVIGEEAFKYCKQLAEVVLNEGLEEIKQKAFSCCISSTRLNIPCSVKVIGEEAFSGCEQLVQLVLNEGLEVIEQIAFEGCESLTRLNIPCSVKVIGERAFSGCEQLVVVVLNEGIEVIGERAFHGCKFLSAIQIPSTIKVIEKEAFSCCKQLVEVVLNEGIEVIRKSAFYGCISLTRLNIPSTVKVIREGAFTNCEGLVQLVLNEGLEVIEERAFEGCESLTAFKIPQTVKIIGDEEGEEGGVFAFCKQLLSIELGEGVKAIVDFEFRGCRSLRNVVIPPTTNVSQSSFTGCFDLYGLFGSQEKVEHALKNRFDRLPIHRLCYYQSYHSTDLVIQQITDLFSAMPDESEGSLNIPIIIGKNQDCLGMTPLHVLACSTKHNLGICQLVMDKCPECLMAKDKWGCLPILYTIWSKAPQEILQFFIENHKSTFSDVDLNWDHMITTLCRAGSSFEAVQMLLNIQRKHFPEGRIDWEKAAKELAIRYLMRSDAVRGFRRFYEDSDQAVEAFFEEWRSMMNVYSTSAAYQGLAQKLTQIEQTHFSEQNNINWQLLCGSLVMNPLDGWWNPDFNVSLFIFSFLAKCNITKERLDAIGIRMWRQEIKALVEKFSSTKSNEFYYSCLESRIGYIYSKLVAYEGKYCQLTDATTLLELALWKHELPEVIDGSMQRKRSYTGQMKENTNLRKDCRTNCGATVIIPNVLSFLIDDKEKKDVDDASSNDNDEESLFDSSINDDVEDNVDSNVDDASINVNVEVDMDDSSSNDNIEENDDDSTVMAM